MTAREAQQHSVRVDRLPPHAPEFEQGLLGCSMMGNMEALDDIVEANTIGREAFYDLRHMTIWDAIMDMREKEAHIDLITVCQYLQDRNLLNKCGGMTYLSSLQDAVPSAWNWKYYLDGLRKCWVQRSYIKNATELVTRIYDEPSVEIGEIVEMAETSIMGVSQAFETKKTPTIKELVHRTIEQIEECHNNKGRLPGIPTGFADIDSKTLGLRKQEMIVIAARPSVGKTSLAMNIVENVCLEKGIPVGVFSMEMSADSLTMRLMASMARVNLTNLLQGVLVQRDFPRLTRAAGRLSEAPLHIDDEAGLTIGRLKAKSRRMASKHGIKLIVVDYLQLLIGSDRRMKREEVVGEASNGLKHLAKQLDIPVIVLSQLNRESDKDKNRRPRLSDLRESGRIEQDADVVGLLYRAGSQDDSDLRDEPGGISVHLDIAKQRNGPTGIAPLTFLRGYTRFESAARISDQDVPHSRAPYADE